MSISLSVNFPSVCPSISLSVHQSVITRKTFTSCFRAQSLAGNAASVSDSNSSSSPGSVKDAQINCTAVSSQQQRTIKTEKGELRQLAGVYTGMMDSKVFNNACLMAYSFT